MFILGVSSMIFTLLESTSTLTNAFTTTNGSKQFNHYLWFYHRIFKQGDIILFDGTFTTITGSNFEAADFDDKKFMVTSVPTVQLTLRLQCLSNETGSGATTSGGIRLQFHYYPVGPAQQLGGLGWGIGQWGGTVSGEVYNNFKWSFRRYAYGTDQELLLL